MKKFIIYLLILNFLSACQTAREGFTLKKKDDSDEFLVEKKSPLVMPPNYEELPKPKDFQLSEENKKDDDFKKIINTTKKTTTNKGTKKTSLEESIIEKIN
tara:strand:- start:18 stop:320 length:303 start_codon:yes stop_codon:yes gene_type:complete